MTQRRTTAAQAGPAEPTTIRAAIFYAAADYDELGVDGATSQAIKRIKRLLYDMTEPLARGICQAYGDEPDEAIEDARGSTPTWKASAWQAELAILELGELLDPEPAELGATVGTPTPSEPDGAPAAPSRPAEPAGGTPCIWCPGTPSTSSEYAVAHQRQIDQERAAGDELLRQAGALPDPTDQP